jgi:tRNA nucleotidyltransferase/poly(A) polymerase
MEELMKLILRILRHAEKLGLDKETLLTMPLLDAMIEIDNAERMWRNLMKEIPDER